MLSSGVIARAKCRVVRCVILNTRPKLCLPRVSHLARHAVRPVFRVSDCRDLQEVEIVFSGIAKISDVATKGGTPIIVLANAAVQQQVVPPSKRARLLWPEKSWKSWASPQSRERLASRFVPRIFRCNAVPWLRRKLFVRSRCRCCSRRRPWRNRSMRLAVSRRDLGVVAFERRGWTNDHACVPEKLDCRNNGAVKTRSCGQSFIKP